MRFLCLDEPVIIQNRWYNKVYSCEKLFNYLYLYNIRNIKFP